MKDLCIFAVGLLLGGALAKALSDTEALERELQAARQHTHPATAHD